MRVTQGPGISHLRIPVDLDAKDEFHLSAPCDPNGPTVPGLKMGEISWIGTFFLLAYTYIYLSHFPTWNREQLGHPDNLKEHVETDWYDLVKNNPPSQEASRLPSRWNDKEMTINWQRNDSDCLLPKFTEIPDNEKQWEANGGFPWLNKYDNPLHRVVQPEPPIIYQIGFVNCW